MGSRSKAHFPIHSTVHKRNPLALLPMTPAFRYSKAPNQVQHQLVSTASMHWADFKGVRTSTTHRGISHADVVDMRRMRFTSKSPAREDEVSDIVPFYIGIVKELKELGY